MQHIYRVNRENPSTCCVLLCLFSHAQVTHHLSLHLCNSHTLGKKQNKTKSCRGSSWWRNVCFASHGYINKQTKTRLCMFSTSVCPACKVSCDNSPMHRKIHWTYILGLNAALLRSLSSHQQTCYHADFQDCADGCGPLQTKTLKRYNDK